MIGLRGEFYLKVVDAKTGNTRAERHFQNVITNAGLEHFAKGAPGGRTQQIAVGTGTTVPDVMDTALSNELARIAVSAIGTSNPVAPLYEYSASIGGRFAAGAISNTITEIGVFYTSGLMWCRQLILDEQGNPSSLTVLPNEYLDVTYTLWYYPPLQDKTFSFEMNGVTYNCVSRCTQLPAYSNVLLSYVVSAAGFVLSSAYATQELGAVTSYPSGAYYGYSVGSDFTHGGASAPYSWFGSVTLALNNFNVPGGIGSIVVKHSASLPASQISFTPKLPKSETVEMTLSFSQTVGRYIP